ncbi:conserved hypothetical protein [Aspergillus terreus NIH2624]|uniref:R3H domain-containing protein n=1 Tax=Aspergillus terreus (strain NIH 2624 / FGSC A1156) TaxID=341663 RepID=Q0CCM1_ASPTN|nr:uncharacterized protein ATEG_08563 [Aspergillus terreus NIH2624]EAU30695.1 conserved hypothetical protein [Aspergillus terreus NIH2624]
MASKDSTGDEHRLSFAKAAEESVPPESQDRKGTFTTQESSSNVQGDVDAIDRRVDGLTQAVQDVHIIGKKGQESPDYSSEGHENGALKRETSFEDDRTHLSSSSTKPTSFDSKSMASVTTFAMDEKDSLRPDDSASVQAIDEEESLSGPASGAPNSLTGSESGARGLRDIQRARAALQNAGPLFDPNQRVNGLPDSIPNNFVIPNHDAFQSGQPIAMHPFPLEPDEKLLEAMKSPKDRLLILQLEEKVRNFIQHSKEQSLELPPSNAFGRLLAHKLGDYYHLTHFVDNNVTSVRLHRTPFCRLPTPLSVIHASANTTPPPAMPAMKIMRRNDGERPADGSTATSSAVPSKTGSEAGDSTNDGERGGSSAGATPAKDRLTLTREEREAKYQEARERIFRDFPETKSCDGSNGDQSGNMSRSSSTSGRKKAHRQKTPHDDSFEVRSQYNLYYPGVHYHGSTPYNVPMNDPSFPTQPFMVGPGANPPGMGYAPHGPNGTVYSGQVGMNPMPQYSMPVSPQMSPSGPWQNGSVPQSPYSGYASINQSPAMTTKSSPALNTYSAPNGMQYQPTPSGWSSPQYQGGYQPPTHRSHPAMQWPTYPSQPLNPTSYPYAQYPGQHMNTAMNGHQGPHPLPGNFNRSAFNPQTRSFVPGGGSLGRNPSKSGPHAVMGSYPNMQGTVQPHWGGLPDVNKASEGLGPAGPRGPPSGNRDSIAKWGTPSHLPPKPPPSQVPSDFDLKHRTGAPHAVTSLPTGNNGPLVVSGGASLPRAN